MADVYRVGVAIGMTDNATQVLQALSRNILGVNMQAEKLEGGLNRAKLAALGLTGVLAGGATLAGMAKLVGAGKEFVHQQSLMMQAGVSHRDIAQATASAWQAASNVIGSSAEKNIALVADLRNQLGSMQEAVTVLPQVAQMGVVLQNLTGQDQEKAGFTAIRYLDQRGALVDPKTHEISTAHLTQQMRLLEGIAVGTRGRAGPDQLLAFQQYARLAGASLSDVGLMNLAPVIAASGSASSVGTQLSSLQQQLVGGVMTSAGARWLERLGLMDGRRVHEGRGGHLTLDPGALTGASQLQSDPVSWVRDNLIPALRRSGATTSEEQAAALLNSHLRSTVIGLLGEVVRNMPAFQRDASNIQRAVGVDQYHVATETDPTAKLNAFSTAWRNLLTALGAPIVNDATGMIGRLTGVITTLTDTARKHPRAVADIELGVAGIAGLIALSGSIAVAGAALGPFTAGLKLLLQTLSTAKVPAAGLSGGVAASAAPAAGAATASVASRAGTFLGRTLGFAGLAFEGVSLYQDQKNRDAQMREMLRSHPKEAQQAQWMYDHSLGLFGENMREGQPTQSQQPIHVTTQVVLDKRVIAEALSEYSYQQTRQSMRASGTAPDLMQYPQVPGRSVGN
ncbi:phage tail tape measure protein [Acetobacter orientalis]|uniref:Prophage transmembrane protein n=1 Tax=Acetobacter orientalis TaxID=146474 RepID=A0A0D6NLG1_9PROT|nr:hypothetical protein [Acetobacter orientalis]GAN66922.1 prophage transmembrane protein [Acetobacter orientalis]GBR14202.1 hypothetical protein AA0481_0551 [Acetobacter orientalis NRIC 0481]GEL60833.1 hypothetical protein AOR02nite_06750 [Acetobacter orientalis]